MLLNIYMDNVDICGYVDMYVSIYVDVCRYIWIYVST